MSTFSKSQHTNSVGSKLSRAEEQDVTSQKSFPVPRSGRGRGARFKYLQSQPNLDICITREIENAVGTAHRMDPSNARHAFGTTNRMDPSNARHALVTTHQMAPSTAHHPYVPPEDEVELIRGTSRGWIPMEFREAARNKDPTILKDLAAHEEVMPWGTGGGRNDNKSLVQSPCGWGTGDGRNGWGTRDGRNEVSQWGTRDGRNDNKSLVQSPCGWGTGDGRNDDKSLVQSPCGRYWTVDKRNTLADFIPHVPKVKDTQSDTGILTQVSHDIPVVSKVKGTGILTQVSHDKEMDDKRDTTYSEMGDSVYSTVPSTVCSRDGEDEDEKYI